MNVAFVGGGSFRTLPMVRAAMADRELFDGGSIRLVDFNLDRAEAVGRMIMKTPEYAASNCAVSWTDKLEKALPGADMVSVSFPVGSLKVNRLSDQASLKHGFFGSDQLSVSGAFRSITGGVIIQGIAKAMERHCPNAWMVDFANPVSVYSGMVNNHTTIKALGICAGFANHRWDLNRLLFDKDACCEEFKVVVAGVNHCSLILRGTYRGRDLYQILDKKIGRKGWKPCRITTYPEYEKRVQEGLSMLAEMQRRFGSILFSNEFDGMAYVFFDELMAGVRKTDKTLSSVQLDIMTKDAAIKRKSMDVEFRSHLDRDLDSDFWAQPAKRNPFFAANPMDPTVPIMRALGGRSKEWLVASMPNRGAIKGFKDRAVVEFSLQLDKNCVHPDPDLEVPDFFHGLMSSLAACQTLLGDSIFTRDPKLFADALFCYPLYQNTKAAKALWKDLLKIHAKEMPPEFQKAKDYF